MHPIALLQLFLAVMHILSLCWRYNVRRKRIQDHHVSMRTAYCTQCQLTDRVDGYHTGWLFEENCLNMEVYLYTSKMLASRNGLSTYRFTKAVSNTKEMYFVAPGIAHVRCASLRLAARGMQNWSSSGHTLPIPLMLDILDQVISGWVQDVRKHQGAHDAKRRAMLDSLHAQGISVPAGY